MRISKVNHCQFTFLNISIYVLRRPKGKVNDHLTYIRGTTFTGGRSPGNRDALLPFRIEVARRPINWEAFQLRPRYTPLTQLFISADGLYLARARMLEYNYK